jgi:hypothetical protein
LVDPPPPPSRAFTGNGAPSPRRREAAAGDSLKVNGSAAEFASPIDGGHPAPAPAVPRAAAPPALEIASDEVIEELSDVVLGAMAAAPPKARPRENGYGAAPPNGSNGHAGKSADPFAALVESALGYADHDAEFEARVAQIVDEAVQGAMHTIRERITHEVISTYRRIAV